MSKTVPTNTPGRKAVPEAQTEGPGPTQLDHTRMAKQAFFDRLRHLASAEVAEQIQREYGGSQVYVPLPRREQESAK